MNSSSVVTLALLDELATGERRVALIPDDIRRLGAKAQVLVELGAGIASGYSDAMYKDAGAELVRVEEATARAEVFVSVRAPMDLNVLRPGSTLISLGGWDGNVGQGLHARGIEHLALERLPRITRAQSMDVLSSQAAIAGYAAVIEGARHLGIILPMLTTAAGTIKPAKMIALGAGVAGLQAIATARRLGAVVHGFDVREAAREQVESLGARFVFPTFPVAVSEDAGGYAADQTEAQQVTLRRALSASLAQMRLVVTSAQIPRRPAPILIDDETLSAMAPGSVIVDLAAESGGNTSHTVSGEIVTVHGVHIIGSSNLPSLFATDASKFFSSNVRSLLLHVIDAQGHFELRTEDPITRALLGLPPQAVPA